jgi:molybdopterin synthase catalytic subunit
MIDVRVQSTTFDPGGQLARLAEVGAGAVVAGLIQAECAEGAGGILIEHYAAMAKAELTRIAEEAAERWPLAGMILIHRHGRFQPGDPILFAGVAASDRKAAAAALDHVLDGARTRAPFWRKALMTDGSERWL